MSEPLQVLELSFDHRPQSLKANPPPIIMPSVLTMRPRPARQNGLALAVWYHTQRADSEQERFSTGLLTPGTDVQILFYMGQTWEHFSSVHYLLSVSC